MLFFARIQLCELWFVKVAQCCFSRVHFGESVCLRECDFAQCCFPHLHVGERVFSVRGYDFAGFDFASVRFITCARRGYVRELDLKLCSIILCLGLGFGVWGLGFRV